MAKQAIVDIECYRNYFLICAKLLDKGKVIGFEKHDDKELDIHGVKQLLSSYEIVTFNGNNYDMPMIQLALTGVSCHRLKVASDSIIQGDVRPWLFYQNHNLNNLYPVNTVDIIELCIGKSSLKSYGGRLHCKKLQDLPIEPDQSIAPEQRELLKRYCANDLEITELLLEEVKPALELRRSMSSKYRIDLRSKSDAQIAEAVIGSDYIRRVGSKPDKPFPPDNFYYQIPDFIQPSGKGLNRVLNLLVEKPFRVNASGSVEMPRELLDMKVSIGKGVFQLGIGGLHSTEKSVNHKEDTQYVIRDWDVTSYYPSIILKCGLFPENLGKEFLDIYRDIYNERIAAKASGNKTLADTYKIVLNGSFGKFGSPYSILYSPQLMIQVTITGQLSLLMLIEQLEEHGIRVVSANTDGVTIKCQRNREKVMEEVISNWEELTGFQMERTDYQAIYSRDVNNYFAVKSDGTIKCKGTFGTASLSKNPQNEICNIAVIEFLTNGTPLEQTITDCRDIRKFLTVRYVKEGASKNGKYLGKVIRWYYAKEIYGTINYRKSGSVVPNSQNGKPLMEITGEFLSDVNYDWYITECKSILNDVGIHSIGQMSFDF